MSAAIQSSLQKLNASVQHLERSVVSVQTKARAKPRAVSSQDDLFAAASNPAPAQMSGVNVRQLAARLDTAIEQVETILKEGRG